MTKDEFLADLPSSAICDLCHKRIENVQWTVHAWSSCDWMGIGIVKCEPCSRLKIAAAGSSDSAYKQAQDTRSKLVDQMGL